MELENLLEQQKEITVKLENAQSMKEWEKLHKEKVCIAREIEFLRGY